MSWQDNLRNDPAGAALLDNQLQSVNFIISPAGWHLADIAPRAQWRSVKFEKTKKDQVPDEPGLYAFVVKIPYEGLPPHGWILYVGQSGHGTSTNTLKERFGEYFHDKEHSRRPKVYYFLNAWDGHIEFHFASLPGRKAELLELETKLLGAFRPPFTDRTYPATYMSPAHAF